MTKTDSRSRRANLHLIYVWTLGIYSVVLVGVVLIALFAGNMQAAETGYIVAGIVGLAVGWFISIRRPENRVGPVLVTATAALVSMGVSNMVVPWAVDHGRSGIVVAAQMMGDFGWAVFFLATLVLLPLWFPTGQAMSPRWAWVGRLAIGSAVIAVISLAIADPVCVNYVATSDACLDFPNPWGIPGFAGFEGLMFVAVLAAPFSIASLFVRYRRSDAVVRQQLKWFVLAAILLLIAFLVSTDLFHASQSVIDVVYGFALLSVWASIALAVLRYRLYDIDRIISRTVTYAIVAGVLFGLVALVAALVGSRFESPVVVAATTLGVAAVFNPLRRRVQDLVDRRFNRARYDTQRVMDDFAATLRDGVDPELVIEGWADVVNETMQPSAAGVWVREP